MREEMEPLKRFWTDPNLSEGDKFLRDYITKQMWKGDDRTKAAPVYGDEQVDDEEDAVEVEEMEEYEHVFNHRFEEPDGAEVGDGVGMWFGRFHGCFFAIIHFGNPRQIRSYPRDVSSVRRNEDKRALLRQRRLERRAEVRGVMFRASELCDCSKPTHAPPHLRAIGKAQKG